MARKISLILAYQATISLILGKRNIRLIWLDIGLILAYQGNADMSLIYQADM